MHAVNFAATVCRQIARRQAGLAVAGALLFGASLAGAAPHGPSASVDPASLDVAGVKLGMTVDETVAALKAFDSGYATVEHYADSEVRFGYYGLPRAEVTNSRPSYLIGLRATKDDAADHEEVFVYFSPEPGKQKVILVSRAKQFGAPQLGSSLADGLLSKYPKDTTFDQPANANEASRKIGWRFDGRGRIMSATVAQQESLAQGIEYRAYEKPAAARPVTMGDLRSAAILGGGSGGPAPGYGLFPPLPRTVLSDGGIALDASIGTPRDNPALAIGFAIVLYRGADVYNFEAQATATYTQMKDAREKAKQQEEIEKAKGNTAPATKF